MRSCIRSPGYLQGGDVVGARPQLAALHAPNDFIHLRVGGSGNADLIAFRSNVAVDEVGFGTASLRNVLRHGGTLLVGALLRGFEQDVHDLGERVAIALSGARQRFRFHTEHAFQLIAVRLADANRFRAKPDREPTRPLGRIARIAVEPARGGKAVAHGIDDELRPALAPEIGGDFRAVCRAQEVGDFLRALADAAVHFTDAENDVLVAADRHRALDVSRLIELRGHQARDAAQRLAPADDGGDALLVDAILQG